MWDGTNLALGQPFSRRLNADELRKAGDFLKQQNLFLPNG